MRTLTLLAVTVLVGFFSSFALAADPVVIPPANVSVLTKLQGLMGPVLSASQAQLDVAKTSALMPLAGAAVKTKVADSQAQVDSANTLNNDLTSLLGGKAASSTGLLSMAAAGNGASLTDRFKNIPGAQILTQVLTTPGVAQALLSVTPVDQVPGYDLVKSALSL